MVKVICQVCSKDFEAARKSRKYCSENCRNVVRRENYTKTEKERLTRKCLCCENSFVLRNKYAAVRALCYDCMPEGIQFKRADFINLLRLKKGGSCVVCGYSKYLGALDFHHLDPNKKEFGIGDGDFRLVESLEEIKKCVLLCSNCHREYHAGLIKLEEYVE